MIIQEVMIPKIHPTAVHNSNSPTANAAPGKPNINHADSPDARSEKAITTGPNRFPPKAKSLISFISRAVINPTNMIISK